MIFIYIYIYKKKPKIDSHFCDNRECYNLFANAFKQKTQKMNYEKIMISHLKFQSWSQLYKLRSVCPEERQNMLKLL